MFEPCLPRSVRRRSVVTRLAAARAGSWAVIAVGAIGAGLVGAPSARGQSYVPSQIRTAYGVNAAGTVTTDSNGLITATTGAIGAGTTIAIVDSNNDASAVGDANAFSKLYNLPTFNNATGPKLTVVNQTGGANQPSTAATGSSLAETSLDIQWAHAIAPGANILLVQANTLGDADLTTAIRTAKAAANVSTVSLSFGGGEYSGQRSASTTSLDDATFTQAAGHNGVAFLAATGDSGTVSYPATSPFVIAVGGTSLKLNANNTRASETVWNNTTDGTGGQGSTGAGVSTVEAKPTYQSGVTSVKLANGTTQAVTNRVIPDVAWDGDPYTGNNVYFNGGINPYQGGTSISCPQWAGLIALADGLRVANKLDTLATNDALTALYGLMNDPAQYKQAFYDVTSGTANGYAATTGYDAASGLGSPNDTAFLVNYLATYAVPEPTSLALLVISVAPLIGGRRWRGRPN